MEQRTFNQLLAAAVKNGASDVHIKAHAPPALRINGALLPVKVPALMPQDTANIAKFILESNHLRGDLKEVRDVDTSYCVDHAGRLRTNIFKQNGNYALVRRPIPITVPTLAH